MNRSALLGLLAVPMLLAWKSPSDFPPYVKLKTLYAAHDVRGTKFGPLEFGKAIHGSLPTKEDLSHKVILIDFWATWCGPCRAVIPEMNEWQKKFAKDLIVVGVSDEKPETVSGFMKETPMQYTVSVDQAKTMSKALGVQGIPHVLVISQDGVVRYQGFPLQEEDKLTTEKLAQIIEASKSLK